jgi:hypothetical protein
MADENVINITTPPVEVTPTKNEYSDEQVRIAKKIATEAELQGLDPNLALSIAHIENRFKSGPSPAGALGPMQLMPGTAKDLKVDPNNEDENIRGGITYYKQQLDKYGDPYVAGIAYNAGPGVADEFLKSHDTSILPDETFNYVKNLADLHAPKEDQGDMPYVSEEVTSAPIPEDAGVSAGTKVGATVAGGTAGYIAGKVAEGTIAKDAQLSAKASTELEKAADKAANARAHIDSTTTDFKGRIGNQAATVAESAKNLETAKLAHEAAQTRLADAIAEAKNKGLLSEEVSPKVSTDKQFRIQHGTLDDTQASSRARQQGYNELTHQQKEAALAQERTIEALKRKGIVGEVSPVVKAGPMSATPTGILVKPGTPLTETQSIAQHELSKAQAAAKTAEKNLNSATSIHAKESKTLHALTAKGPTGLTEANARLAAAKAQHARAAGKVTPTWAKVVQATSKAPFLTHILPGAGAGFDIADAKERFAKGDYTGGALSSVGALGGALSMVPPLPPIGTLARLAGLPLSLVPLLNIARDNKAANTTTGARVKKLTDRVVIKPQ